MTASATFPTLEEEVVVVLNTVHVVPAYVYEAEEIWERLTQAPKRKGDTELPPYWIDPTTGKFYDRMLGMRLLYHIIEQVELSSRRQWRDWS